MTDFVNLLVQIILIAVLSVISFLLLRTRKSLVKEKRLTKFSVDAISEKHVSLFDKMEKYYADLVNSLSKFLKKTKIFDRYSKKYEIYVDQTEVIRKNSMDFISHKVFTSLATVFITIISDVLRIQPLTVFQVVFCLVIGFYIPDFFLYLKNRRERVRIENDLLKAVTIMNNAFKSGRSIMQAVELVYTELDGPISEEFRKMFIDLTYGLELDVVFKRFSDRVQLEEIKYMSASLVILNKTGGNIIKVFSTIERGFFDRKKLKQELKSATALSELVFKLLVVMPVLIFVLVYIFNSNYYTPLFTTTIGRIILVVILIIYILYILIVKKLTKLKEWLYAR